LNSSAIEKSTPKDPTVAAKIAQKGIKILLSTAYCIDALGVSDRYEKPKSDIHRS
jgi:hypothetical protein